MIYFLSDMYGFAHHTYGYAWKNLFTNSGLDCELISLPTICGLDDETVLSKQETELHLWYLEYGLEQGLFALKQKLQTQDVAIGCSMGGYLAYLHHRRNDILCPLGTIMLSSTRLRTVASGEICCGNLFALFGEDDPYLPMTSHLVGLGIDIHCVSGSHDIYKEPHRIFKLVRQCVVNCNSTMLT